MDTIRLVHAKLHRVVTTECRKDYVGSISIDERWLRSSGILPLEEVHVCNVTNGSRFVTYALPAPSGSCVIAPNGACAHLCSPGDVLIIFSFTEKSRQQVLAEGHRAKVLIFGDGGAEAELQYQDLVVKGDGSFGLFIESAEEAIVLSPVA